MTGTVGIVVVTFSPGDALNSFLDSVPAATSRPTRIIMADNGSTDGSVEAAAAAGRAELLRTGGNLGYGSAANRGVAALPAEIEYVMVANPDVVLGAGSVDTLLAAARDNPRAGALGPAIRTPDGALYPSARRLPTLSAGAGHAVLGWLWPRNPWTRAYRAEDEKVGRRTAGWLSGSCLLLRRAAFDDVGGFDERYFMYFEDIDLADRLMKAGWQNLYVPDAEVEHIGGHATERTPGRMLDEHHRSAYRYLADRRPARWQAPIRWGLKGALTARAAVARRSRKVAAGAAIDGSINKGEN
ncbi:glycosyltransferase family 2 protein [Nakamurella lactea]|uniref:glycosyltransferase family 2 protein n=1 Tax=Nakamurella lactea TaxID=459515 RepID=UPI000401B248|nr:glycosyltransferase family 2 protein [Nakamurella lactea]